MTNDPTGRSEGPTAKPASEQAGNDNEAVRASDATDAAGASGKGASDAGAAEPPKRPTGTLRMPGHEGGDSKEDAAEAGAPTSGDDGAAAANPAAAADADKLILALEAEKADLNDRLLRAMADTQNLRKRMDKDVTDARKYAVSAFAQDIIKVTDDLQRASATQLDDQIKDNESVKALFDGVTMIERSFLGVLERHGIKPITAEGSPFDPHLHQAVFQVHDPDVPAGTVKQVHQTGFTIGERVLRPAMVAVSEGGMKPVKAPPANEGGPGDATAKPATQDGDAASAPPGEDPSQAGPSGS
ncbi:MAG: nucleotide exchange factor GrpE [Pseudomonadota bacterium]